MTEVLLEVTNGQPAPPREKPARARARTELEREVENIRAAGGIVDIPPELP